MATQIDFSSIREEIERAIVATLPSGHRRRNKAVFEFCRHLKSIPALSTAEPADLRGVALEWHRRALPFIATASPEETLADFYQGWPNVKFPVGESPLTMLFEEALSEALPHCAEQYETHEVKVLIALCRKLQHHSNPDPFFLACRKAGELLRKTQTTANAWLSLLQFDGVLELHTKGSQSTHKASRYYYRGD